MNLAQLIKYYELKLKGGQEIINITPNMVKETIKHLSVLYEYMIDDPTLDELFMEQIKEGKKWNV